MIVDAGLQHIADQMAEQNQSAMSHMAVGTDGTAVQAGDTTLGAEIARVALTSVTRSGSVATYVASFPAGTGTGALQEAGVFNAASAGTLLSRIGFAVKNKGANDSMTLTIEHTYARG